MAEPVSEQERYRQVQRLFSRVCGLPAQEREALLGAAEPGVAAEVRAMLAVDSRTGPLDHASALGGLAGEAASAWGGALPARIGPYAVIRELGRGATGVVLEGERDRPRKRAALKVLRLDSASDVSRRRFEHEAEILARLRHPGIAQVFEGGVYEDGGPPLAWFALELVPGAKPITAYCRDEGLPLRDRIELFALVCDAVNEAHRNGVIHRDLKPANILVGADGAPKVIDFGIARVADPAVTALTTMAQAGAIIGTISHMSPEQWAGRPEEVDARTDVYALGVVLYELLTGEPPYDLRGLSVQEAMRVVLGSEPRDPAVIDARLRGNLRAIVLKAMARDREKRYQWAEGLARDLRDHLAGRPTTARTRGAWQRLAAWIGRHPVATTAAACAVVAGLTLGGTIVSVGVLARRPAHIALDRHERSAWLESVAGHRLHVWQDGAAGGIVGAALVDRPAEFGGGRIAVVTRSVHSDHAELSGHVALYDVSRPDEPVWSTRDAPLTIPVGYEDRIEIQLSTLPTVVANIFDEVPGKQIATAQSLWPYSPVCIRVFDLAGRELYSVWHDGGVTDMRWLPDRRQLVVTAFCSAARWDERGEPWSGGAAYPRVVFAVEPRLGHAGTPWTLGDDRVRDPTVLWCRWLGPPEPLTLLEEFRLVLETRPHAMGGSVVMARVSVVVGGDEPAILDFALDAMGAEVRRSTCDRYKAAMREGLVPDPGVFRLLDIADLPPRLAADETAERSPH